MSDERPSAEEQNMKNFVFFTVIKEKKRQTRMPLYQTDAA
jgi:hypothetical protein